MSDMVYSLSDRTQAYWLLRQLRNRKNQEWKQLLREPKLSAIERDIRRVNGWIRVMSDVIKGIWVTEREGVRAA